MGIVNVTPDSFSDGGRFLDPVAAIDRGAELADDGADILDIGGQSTRPGAERVGPDEELRRVMPIVAALCEQTSLPISIDTFHAAVAREALKAGVEIINDVTALTGDPAMVALAAETACGVCAMHMRGTPETMQKSPTYDDVVEEVLSYLEKRRDAMRASGIQQARIAIDPGIGFGKTTEHNLALLSHASRFHRLGCPVLIGHGRKRFIGEILGDPTIDRTAGTTGVAVSLAQQDVHVLRIHDVAPIRQALLLWSATRPAGNV